MRNRVYKTLLLALWLTGCSGEPSQQNQQTPAVADEVRAFAAETGLQSSPDAGAIRAKIGELTKKLSKDWNRGDMDAYLNAYQPGTGTSLLFGGTILGSSEEIRSLFTQTWTTEEAMGDFETRDVVVQLIAPGVAIARGHFEHQFPAEKVSGVFTHVWRQGDGTWKIVHEHTSRGAVEHTD